MIELDKKLLIELRLSLCISSLYKLLPLDKLAGMLTFKLFRLVDFIQRDFPTEAALELISLNQTWHKIVRDRLHMKYDECWKLGEAVYQEITKYKQEIASGEPAGVNSVEELYRINSDSS